MRPIHWGIPYKRSEIPECGARRRTGNVTLNPKEVTCDHCDVTATISTAEAIKHMAWAHIPRSERAAIATELHARYGNYTVEQLAHYLRDYQTKAEQATERALVDAELREHYSAHGHTFFASLLYQQLIEQEMQRRAYRRRYPWTDMTFDQTTWALGRNSHFMLHQGTITFTNDSATVRLYSKRPADTAPITLGFTSPADMQLLGEALVKAGQALAETLTTTQPAQGA